MLKKTFFKLINNYTSNNDLIENLWKEIEKQYSSQKRHYHNLNHLENLLEQLLKVKSEIKDWNVVLFTLYYHDIIYNALKKDNEEKSANCAKKVMFELNISSNKIELCYSQIIATKSHHKNTNEDTNLFTDADLSILGFPSKKYRIYYTQVRKEYKMFPDFMYNPNRKKVLQKFLKMKRIFKTDYFFNSFEKQARINLKSEIKIL